MPSSPAARQRALFAFLCFVWGTTWLAMKVGIATVPPGIFAGSRWTSAGLILLLCALRRRADPRARRCASPAGCWSSRLLMVTLNQVIQLYGLKYITAGLAAVLSARR